MAFKLLNMADISICPDVFKPLDGLAEVVTKPADQKLLSDTIHQYEGYFAALKVRLTGELIDRAKKLKVIVTPSTGLDHIDVEHAERKGITIISLKKETEFLDSVTATAEMAWALLLAVVRKLPWSFDDAKKGIWSRDKFRGCQLSTKTFGIIGYGRLGKIIAEYARGFRMRVLATDIRNVQTAEGVELVDLDTLLRESDVISLHIHLTDQNRRFINREKFTKMKKGAYLINTSRGGIIDEKAFVEALESGRLGGAGVDVIEGEWRDDLHAHPLIRYASTHDNLVISPHTAGVTYESQSTAMEHIVGMLKSYLISL
jgi:D-3-phosphoglycerate dehydrogenase